MFLRSDIMAFALLDFLVLGTYLALREYLFFGTRSNEKENSNDLWIKGRRMGVWNGILQNVVYVYIFFNSSPTALLPFAISLIIQGLLLLRSSQKKYCSSSGCSLQHLDIIISPWVSCPLGFFHIPFFSSVIYMMRDWCQVINFTFSGKKKKNLSLNWWFIL